MRLCIHIYVQGKGYHIPPRLRLGRELSNEETAFAILDQGYYGSCDVSTWWKRFKIKWMLGKIYNRDEDLKWMQLARPEWMRLLKEAATFEQ